MDSERIGMQFGWRNGRMVITHINGRPIDEMNPDEIRGELEWTAFSDVELSKKQGEDES